MRKVSKKRAKLNASVKKWREDLRWEVGGCEYCMHPFDPKKLDVHELVPGSSRAKALDKRFAVLVVSRACHNILEALPIPWQIPYLMRSRPEDFDIEAYYKLIGRRWPDMETLKANYQALFDMEFVK